MILMGGASEAGPVEGVPSATAAALFRMSSSFGNGCAADSVLRRAMASVHKQSNQIILWIEKYQQTVILKEDIDIH
jgi:hypothetical protein